MFPLVRSLLSGKFVATNVHRPIISSAPMNAVKGTRTFCDASVKVVHDEKNKEFYILINKKKATLTYEKVGNTLKIMHVEVPFSLSGQGIGTTLSQAAVEYVKKNQYRAECYCGFFRSYIDRNEPDFVKYLNN